MALLSLLILGKAFYIQRFQGSYWHNLSDGLHQRMVEIDADRGTIYSEDGQMLRYRCPSLISTWASWPTVSRSPQTESCFT